MTMRSRPARGAWIEIAISLSENPASASRAPQGARGLKFDAEHIGGCLAVSRPARGAWIEMSRTRTSSSWSTGRAPQGARGLKCKNA